MTSLTLAQYYKNTSPQIGSYIIADTWENRGGVRLIKSDWNEAQFRAPLKLNLAVNIKVTGRTVQFPYKSSTAGRVRIQIEFVGDGEPSQFVGGWMTV